MATDEGEAGFMDFSLSCPQTPKVDASVNTRPSC